MVAVAGGKNGNGGMSLTRGIGGNGNNGGGNLNSGYIVGRLGMIPPGGRAGSARSGISGKAVVGAKSFRVTMAPILTPKNDIAMKKNNTAKTKVREDAAMIITIFARILTCKLKLVN